MLKTCLSDISFKQFLRRFCSVRKKRIPHSSAQYQISRVPSDYSSSTSRSKTFITFYRKHRFSKFLLVNDHQTQPAKTIIVPTKLMSDLGGLSKKLIEGGCWPTVPPLLPSISCFSHFYQNTLSVTGTVLLSVVNRSCFVIMVYVYVLCIMFYVKYSIFYHLCFMIFLSCFLFSIFYFLFSIFYFLCFMFYVLVRSCAVFFIELYDT